MYKILRPLLFQFDPENIHHVVLKLASFLGRSHPLVEELQLHLLPSSKKLQVNILGLNFPGPIGLAAGFDKNGEAAPFLSGLGFGFLELGSITAHQSNGNPRPRLFRLPDERAIINRMGLGNIGAQEAYNNLKHLKLKIPFGINIAKTHDPAILGTKAIDDFLFSYEILKNIGDYTCINISCPNTKEGKTFEQDPEALKSLLQSLSSKKSSRPLLLKLSPDLTEAEVTSVCELSLKHGIDGFIVGNTSLDRSTLKTSQARLSLIGKGGLSGFPIKNKSNLILKQLSKITQGKVPLIGTGGILSTQDVLEKLASGAHLVQVYTGLIYGGPLWISRINLELAAK